MSFYFLICKYPPIRDLLHFLGSQSSSVRETGVSQLSKCVRCTWFLFPRHPSAFLFYLIFFLLHMECGGHGTVCYFFFTSFSSIYITPVLMGRSRDRGDLYYVFLLWHCDRRHGVLGDLRRPAWEASHLRIANRTVLDENSSFPSRM